jgi:hypothetical protein
MPQVGFEPTIPVFEQAKTVHALYRTVTAIGAYQTTNYYNPDQLYATSTVPIPGDRRREHPVSALGSGGHLAIRTLFAVFLVPLDML